MRNIFILLFLTTLLSCKQDNTLGFNTEKKSISNVLKRFPLINKDLKLVRKVGLDSMSISLLKNKSKGEYVYDEVLVFEKKNTFYSIPLFSNMYYDYWEFKDESQKQLYPKTGSTFNNEIHQLIKELQLTPEEFGLFFEELMSSTLDTETQLESKPKLFTNYIYSSNRVEMYKSEESDSCQKRTIKIFEQIEKDSKKTIRYNQYYLDHNNDRIYEIINNSRNYRDFNFTLKTYRINCYMHILSL